MGIGMGRGDSLLGTIMINAEVMVVVGACRLICGALLVHSPVYPNQDLYWDRAEQGMFCSFAFWQNTFCAPFSPLCGPKTAHL